MTRQFGERAGRGVHLVGSVPLSSPDDVFQQLAGALGDRVERLPDGETGPRSDWIVWQSPVLSSKPEFEVCPPGPHAYRSLPRLRLLPSRSYLFSLPSLAILATHADAGYGKSEFHWVPSCKTQHAFRAPFGANLSHRKSVEELETVQGACRTLPVY